MTDDTIQNTPVADKPPENAAITGSSALPQEELNKLTDDIVAALKTVYDPEIPADIYELGLIYKIDIGDDRGVKVDMSLLRRTARRRRTCRSWSRTRVGVLRERPSGGRLGRRDPSRMSDEAACANGNL
jgi:hypothetical protein